MSKLHGLGLNNNALTGKLLLEISLVGLGAKVSVNLALAMIRQLSTPANVEMSAIRACPQNGLRVLLFRSRVVI